MKSEDIDEDDSHLEVKDHADLKNTQVVCIVGKETRQRTIKKFSYEWFTSHGVLFLRRKLVTNQIKV